MEASIIGKPKHVIFVESREQLTLWPVKEDQFKQDKHSFTDIITSVSGCSWFTRVCAVQEYVLGNDTVFLFGRKKLATWKFFSEIRNLANGLDDPRLESDRIESVSTIESISSIRAYISRFNYLKEEWKEEVESLTSSFTGLWPFDNNARQIQRIKFWNMWYSSENGRRDASSKLFRHNWKDLYRSHKGRDQIR
jgi:hypothetical protein